LRETVERAPQGLALDDEGGDHALDVEDRLVEAVEFEQQSAEPKPVEGVNLYRLSHRGAQRVEEGTAADAEQVLKLIADELGVENRVDGVLELSPAIDERAAVAEEMTQCVGVGVSWPARASRCSRVPGKRREAICRPSWSRPAI
jgi:hypothetical protein